MEEVKHCFNCQFGQNNNCECYLDMFTKRKNMRKNANPCKYYYKAYWKNGDKKGNYVNEDLKIQIKSENEDDVSRFMTWYLGFKKAFFHYHDECEQKQQFIDFIRQELGEQVYRELKRNYKIRRKQEDD